MKIKSPFLLTIAIFVILGTTLSSFGQRIAARLIPGAQHHLETALFQAVSAGDTRQMRALLAQGASPNWANYKGKTIWHIAAQAGTRRSEQIFNALDDYTPLWNARDKNGESVFAALCAKRVQAWSLPLGSRFGRALKEGADPNTLAIGGEPVLHFVAAFPAPQVVKQFLQHGAKPDEMGATGETALFVVLIAYGNRPCSGPEDYQAQLRDGKSVARALLEAGANPLLRLHRGTTPLNYARTHKSTRELVPLLQQFASKSH